MITDLNAITITSPCKADWTDMKGNDRVRFCDLCKLNVYNLSGMKKEEAEALVHLADGRLCVRFYKRADGTILTQDCPVGLAAIRKRLMLIKSAVIALIAGAIGLGVWARNRKLTPPMCTTGMIMGEMAAPQLPEHLQGKVAKK